MAEVFGHETLTVYQKGKSFLAIRKQILDKISRRVAACEHLDRGAESILLNVAHASSSWSPKERVVYLGHANGSALECAACLDIFVAKKFLTGRDIYQAKSQLAEIVSMLIAMKDPASNRIREDHSDYEAVREKSFFSHASLDVYQTALQFTGWIESMRKVFSCTSDVQSKLDKSSTAVVLNIAEGNGRFSGTDQARFLAIAKKSTVQSASLIDLATADISSTFVHPLEGRELLQRIATMLTALSKRVTQDT